MTESFRTEEMCFRMKKINLDWTAQLEMKFPRKDVTGVQLYFLVYILRHHPKGTYITELCHEIGVAKSTLSELIKKLREKGYLYFERNPDDIRKKKVVPTEQLLNKAEELLKNADQIEAEIFSVLDRQERIQMWKLEKKLLMQLAKMEDNEKNRQEVYLP